MTGESDYLLRIVIADDDRYHAIHQDTLCASSWRPPPGFQLHHPRVFRAASASRAE